MPRVEVERAIRLGDTAALAALLDAGVDWGDQPPLAFVAGSDGDGAIAALQLLLERGVPDSPDRLGQRALFHATDPRMIEMLLASHSSVTAVDCAGNTALHRACARAAMMISPPPVDHGRRSLLLWLEMARRTRIRLMCLGGRTDWALAEECVNRLLEAGADVHARNMLGETPMHLAATYSESPVLVQALLAAGAEVDPRDERGTTPLILAADTSLGPVMEVLLAAGADCRAANEAGDTPLHEACASSQKVDAVRLLLAGGAEVDARDSRGCTAMHYAVHSLESARVFQQSAMWLLIEAGGSINVADHEGRTPLHRAVWACSPEMVHEMIGCGANVHAEDERQRTPLHEWAFNGCNSRIAGVLIQGGAQVNAPDECGQTPLHLAASRYDENDDEHLYLPSREDGTRVDIEANADWHELDRRNAIFDSTGSVIDALIVAGADLRATDSDGKIPLQVSRSRTARTKLQNAMNV